jgi:hypothetical protein
VTARILVGDAKRYDGRGNPIGQTRVRLARLLREAFAEQLGMTFEIDPARLFLDDRWWSDDRWYGTFWRKTDYGGTQAGVVSSSTMGECVRRGVIIEECGNKYVDQFVARVV